MAVAGRALPAADSPDSAQDVPQPRRRSLDSSMRRLLAGVDAASVLLALGIALLLPAAPPGGHSPLWALIWVPVMLVLFKLYGLYDQDVKRISHSTADDLPWLVHALVVGGLLLWLYSRYTPLRKLDLAEVLVFGLGALGLVSGFRFSARMLAGRLIGREYTIVIGSGGMVNRLIAKLAAHPEHRIEIVGSLSVGTERENLGLGYRNLGSLDALADIAVLVGLDRVILSGADIGEDQLQEVLRRCRTLCLKVSILPRLSDVLGSAVEVDDIEGVTILGVNPPWLPRSSRATKRAMDILIAAALLVLLAPLLLVFAIAIKLESRGPLIFAQERVGKCGRRFRIFKLRTMTEDAERRRRGLLTSSRDQNWLHLEHDPRITRVGRWLRRLSLDEIPQLWNVLRGQMSMVGPRPLIPTEDERVAGWARHRLDLTPGITGYWQVLGRTRIPFEEMVKLDYLYVMNWSIWQDVRLILRTLPVVLRGDGAN